MAQNIVIAGATFNAVPSIVVPTSGNGTAVFVDPSPTTATDSDVASGKVYFKADGTQSTGTASGGSATLITKSITANGTYNASSDNADGYSSVTVNVSGGASNVVTGTFKGTTAGAAMDVALNYSGSGYPVSVEIYPTGGFRGNQSFASLVERNTFAIWSAIKHNLTNAPSYTSDNVDYQNSFFVSYNYKSSSSDATSYTGTTTGNVSVCNNVAATSSSTSCVKLKSATSMSVYIHGSSNYGFAKDIEYTYVIRYSS